MFRSNCLESAPNASDTPINSKATSGLPVSVAAAAGDSAGEAAVAFMLVVAVIMALTLI